MVKEVDLTRITNPITSYTSSKRHPLTTTTASPPCASACVSLDSPLTLMSPYHAIPNTYSLISFVSAHANAQCNAPTDKA